MKTIDVLIIVDVEGALAGSLSDNVYLIDTNKYLGSGAEGQVELRTVCANGQTINWRVVSVSPSNDVEITAFIGQMVNDNICVPVKQGLATDIYWAATVEAQATTGNQQYSVELTMDGRKMTFDPYIVID